MSEQGLTWTCHLLVPFDLQACTGGGCTLSAPSMAQTDESSPEDVPAPSVTYVSPHAINLTWGPPLKPNGESALLSWVFFPPPFFFQIFFSHVFDPLLQIFLFSFFFFPLTFLIYC